MLDQQERGRRPAPYRASGSSRSRAASAQRNVAGDRCRPGHPGTARPVSSRVRARASTQLPGRPGSRTPPRDERVPIGTRRSSPRRPGWPRPDRRRLRSVSEAARYGRTASGCSTRPAGRPPGAGATDRSEPPADRSARPERARQQASPVDPRSASTSRSRTRATSARQLVGVGHLDPQRQGGAHLRVGRRRSGAPAAAGGRPTRTGSSCARPSVRCVLTPPSAVAACRKPRGR